MDNNQTTSLENVSYGEAPIQDVQLKVGDNRKISGLQYFAFAIQSTSGAVGDATFRDLVYTGNKGDLEKSITGLLYNGLGAGSEVTAKYTKNYTIDSYYENNTNAGGTNTGGIIRIPSGKVVEISGSFYSATQMVKFNNLAGSFRFLYGTSLTLSTTNPLVTVINSGATDLQLRMQYATSAAERPIFGIFLKIF